MTDTNTPPHGRSATRPPPTRLDRLVVRARWIIALERLWPPLVLASVIGAIFVALAWLGLWAMAPRILRMAGVLACGAGMGVAAILALRGLLVTRADAVKRLDRDSGLAHRPVSSAEDRLANAGSDPLTLALWDLSRRRLDEVVARIRLRRPAPRLVDRDPYAIRAAALLGLVAAGFVAGEHKEGLLAAAFDWRGTEAGAAGFRIDAWVDPPGYTGKPPVVLMAGGTAAPDQVVAVPIRSTVVVRSSDGGAMDVAAAGALRAAEPVKDGAPAPSGGMPNGPAAIAPTAGEKRYMVDGNGRLSLGHDGRPLSAVTFTAIPDLPPTIVLTDPVRASGRGSLTLAYKIDDDYGVTSAEGTMADPVIADRPLIRSLVPPPRLTLSLPPTPGGLGTGQTVVDLSDHPWAGAEVTLGLSTRDEGGNVGLSVPTRVVLPARRFANPVARALVEQRRNLVFDPDNRDGVATALDALMIGPDQFGTTKGTYLGLYTARQRLGAARSDDDLVALADYLWQMALKLEDGDASAAARDLKAAEQALRDALQRGASSDEIKKLTEALRKEVDKFLAEMARNSQPDRDQAPDPNAKVITQNDLRQMMQRMQQMAQNGDTASAQRMLDQLQNLLDNLKTAQNGNQSRREMRKQMSELDKMTRDQQAVRDKTFKQGQQGKGPSDTPGADDGRSHQSGEGGQPQDGGQEMAGSEDLEGQQQSLRQRLEDLKQRMRQLGLKGEKGLDDAGEAMKDAEGALGEGQGGSRRAVDAQGRALQGLQQGASGLAQQMAQGQGDATGQGEGDGQDGTSIGQAGSGDSGNDPLGRPRDGRGTLETRGRALDESVAARAQRVLQELRRRLGDPTRPTEEMDYLERLLQRY